MTMGEKILAMRKARGWSQEELAEHIGVTRQAVSRWESGAAKPDADKIISICDLFGVSADYLLRENYAEEPQKPAQEPARETELGIALRKLTLNQWLGLLMIVIFGIIMMVLEILSIAFPCWYNGVKGLFGFLMTYHLVWLWWGSLFGVLAGCWKLFVREWLKTQDLEVFRWEE